ncbi:hypothetical protein PR048_015201 [Dryococelus australis]|uniref:Uncharacterized protein n=1 Tax=Dryococelus australis TaxID=614101 RepID=A0ABQ9HH98_9NEOP|nr:hypothetical protein PR048_015201 [Dryococelus australis]
MPLMTENVVNWTASKHKKTKEKEGRAWKCDVMSFNDYTVIASREHVRLENSIIQFECYNGQCVQPVGQKRLWCGVPNTRDKKAKDTNIAQYADLFKGIGCLSGKHHLEIDTGAKPVQPPRRYPIVLWPKVKKKLTEMIKDKIVEQISEPTKWISSLVLEYLNQVHDSDQEFIMQLQNFSMHQHFNVIHTTLGRIKQGTTTDVVLQALSTVIKEGWPERKSGIPEDAWEYWHCRDELSVYDDTIFRGELLVIPQKLKAEMLQKAHMQFIRA